MEKALEERIKSESKVIVELEKELAQAISQVLKEYGVTGEYLFNVQKDADYGHKPVTSLKGIKLVLPRPCLGTGITTVENPNKIYPV
jgi:hypothetical protein